ncbi:hypothetical protein AAF712_004413 [Marasmius tenuissimus]|uniref:Calcineurin-like phosphoesterase domain-containing protein n=1 Tax=Marasmius tenuissimus TaxID=585030 RepID=A0ABR3A4A1_9AGAR
MDVLLNRQSESAWDRFQSSPVLFLARLIYHPTSVLSTSLVSSSSKEPSIRVVCISDTHNTHNSQPQLPKGDILIHAGDLTVSGSRKELDDVLSWLSNQPHPHKIFIAGNHDTCLAEDVMKDYVARTYPELTYLENSEVQVTISPGNGKERKNERIVRVYGSPYTPKHGSFKFQYPRVHAPWYTATSPPTSSYESTKIWNTIPPVVDIVVTHGPPYAHLDGKNWGTGIGQGCYALLTALWRVRPRLHVFGHIHVGRGVEAVHWDGKQRAYEDICAGRAGIIGLVRLTWSTAVAWLSSLFGGQTNAEAMILVNAAAVGGHRLVDDELKGAIVVDI